MFSQCNKLSFSNVGSNLSDAFGTGLTNCTNMIGMFYYVGKNLVGGGGAPNITNFDTTNATNFGIMFQGAKFNTTIDITSWNVPALTNMGAMFYLCELPTQTMDLSAWNFT